MDYTEIEKTRVETQKLLDQPRKEVKIQGVCND